MRKGSIALLISLLVATAGIFVSALTIFEHVLLLLSRETGLTLDSGLCTVGATFNCKKVIGSEWSYLFGIPLGYYGVAFYLLMVALIVTAFDERFVKRAVAGASLFAFSLIAVLVSLFLYYVSAVEIGALCPLCLTTYGLNILLLLSTYFIDRSLPLFTRIIEGLFGVIRYPLLLFRIGAPSDSLAPSLARIWLVGGVLGLLWIQALPDFIANQYVFPRAQDEQRTQEVVRAYELWNAAPVQEIPLSLEGGLDVDYSQGPLDAPIRVVEFSDYQCPACRGAYLTLKPLWEEYRGKILLIHKDYPLDQACNPNIKESFHEIACFAAEFARCAGEQGKFNETADFLFRDPRLNSSKQSEELKAELIASSDGLGMDKVAIEECIASGRQRTKIARDIVEGDALGVEGTPSYWINGKKLVSPSTNLLRKIVADILSEPTTQSAPQSQSASNPSAQ